MALQERLIGARLGKYEIDEEVGYGGMSVVYRARDTVLEREVAVKVLHSHLSKRRDARIRFQREAQAVAKLRHPNIVEIYDYSEEDSRQAYIVTEFIRGPTLREFIDSREQSFPEVGAMIAIQLGEALIHAHRFGVIHRDVKPENVMIRPDGVLKLMDFGIAHLIDAQTVTQTGSLLGSPAHMAPEVISGEEADFRSDIFSLGTVLYYLTTGELPFQGRNPAQALRAIAEGRYMDPEMRDPRIGQKLGAVIRRSMAREPEERHGSLDELTDDLRECIAEVGLQYVDRELRQYFKDPDTYERALTERVLQSLEEAGREALEQRQIARAVDCFNRVLAIDDSHEGVRRLLGRLDRRRRLAAYGLVGAALLGVALLALALTGVLRPAQWFGDDTEETAEAIAQARGEMKGATIVAEAIAEDGRLEEEAKRAAVLTELQARQTLSAMGATALGAPAGEGVVAQSQRIGTALGATRAAEELQRMAALTVESSERRSGRDDSADRGSSEDESDSETEASDEGEDGEEVAAAQPDDGSPAGSPDAETSSAAVTTRPVRLFPNPRIPRVIIDGEDMGVIGIGRYQLTPGTHRVRYSSPYIVDETFVIDVPEGTDEWRVGAHILDWVDATLVVRADRPGTVVINENPIGPTDEELRIPIPNTPEYREGRGSFRLQVIPIGDGAIHSGSVVLAAGETRVERVSLEPQ